VRKLFVRVKETLYRVESRVQRITIAPHKQYLEFGLNNAWVREHVKGLEIGELVLKEGVFINHIIGNLRKRKNRTMLELLDGTQTYLTRRVLTIDKLDQNRHIIPTPHPQSARAGEEESSECDEEKREALGEGRKTW